MYKILFFLTVFTHSLFAQELNCTVKVNFQELGNTNLTVFKTLEKSLTEFINKTNWSDKVYKPRERIDCSMFINISAYAGDQFSATIQVQSSRPVYNSIYSSPVFNYNDKDFNFSYTEFQLLNYNQNVYDSNLISVISFYANMIIGIDGDTFSEFGGSQAYQNAQEIATIAQSSNAKGWSQNDGRQNRFFLVNDMLSPTFNPIREALYNYHFNGLDKMSEDLKGGKEKIKEAIMSIKKVNDVRPNAFLTRIFFDAKLDEIQSVFSGGPKINITDLLDSLNRFSPTNSALWANIKN
jgi:Domain of unknown function (DUF4835)